MPLNMDTSSGAVGDFLTQAAGSALPQSGATGGPASQINPELLKKIMSLGQGSSFAGPMTTAQTAMPQAKPPIQVNPATPQVGGADRSFATKGEAQRAKQQATLNNLANLAKMGEDYEYQKKKREMETIVTKFQGANEGVQQAKDILKQDPNNADAKGQLEHNQGILDDMKIKDWKMIQKAFDVPLIGDKGKQTPEYQGMISAVKKGSKEDIAAANQQMLQRFNQQQPMEQKPSLQAQSASMAQKMGLSPTQEQMMRERLGAAKNITELRKNWDNIEAKKSLADTLAQVKDADSLRRYQASIFKAVGEEKGKQIMADASVKRANILVGGMLKKADTVAAADILTRGVKDVNDKNAVKNIKDLQSSTKSQFDAYHKDLEDTQKDIAKLEGVTWKSPEEKTQLAELKAKVPELMANEKQVEGSMALLTVKMDAINFTNNGAAGAGDRPEPPKRNEETPNPDKWFEEFVGNELKNELLKPEPAPPSSNEE
jgi:hypothetical protein